MKDLENLNQAGWATIDITPPLGVYLGGRGSNLTKATWIKDPLYAFALILEDSQGEQLLLISLDLIGHGTSLFHILRNTASLVSGIDRERVIINSSHTHSGPFTHYEGCAIEIEKPKDLQEYEKILIGKVGEVVAKATSELKEAKIRIHVGESNIGVNRRLQIAEGNTIMAPNPNGAYNRELLVLDIEQKNGERCIAFSHSCHPVINYSVDLAMISADFPGIARRALKQKLGEQTHCQFFQAACGNIRPRRLGEVEEKRFRPSREDDYEIVGKELAEDVLKTLELAPLPESLSINSVESGFLLKKKSEPELLKREYWEALSKNEEHPQRLKHTIQYWLLRLNQSNPILTKSKYASAGIFTLTPSLEIAWIGGEPFAEWQGFLRDISGNPNLLLWGYIGESAGYLPMDHHFAEGGYETGNGQHSPGGPESLALGINQTIADHFQKLFTWLRAPSV